MNFQLKSPFEPQGDQPTAIAQLVEGTRRGDKHQVLLGVTGSGKTFTVAKVIEQINRPTLVLSHNKTLAAQLYQEFKNFFPENRVEYFVSYYDYYQPEAYIPQTDLYIEKEMTKNDEIDKLRLAATKSLFERRDVIIVASVSCIYGIGDPELYYGMLLFFERGEEKPMTQDRLLEAHRRSQRTLFDLEMIAELGFCNGIENYSRHLSGRVAGQPPPTLIDYFPKDFLMIIDESHQTIPQVRGMWGGDRSRKQTLVEYGFRLPSAIDNRPLSFDEFQTKRDQVIYVSATPAPWELEMSGGLYAEQVIRPTGLLDPQIEIRPVKGQVDDLIGVIKERVAKNERVMVTTLTKRMAEVLTRYLMELGIEVNYLHSDIETLERIAILRDFRTGIFDVLIGINLLREGLDIPECSCVAVLDADKEGFLRSQTSLIQTVGRAARNVNGVAILYADVITDSLRHAIDETSRRRTVQQQYNEEHGIEPATIIKAVDSDLVRMDNLDYVDLAGPVGKRHLDLGADEDLDKAISRLTKEMKEAAKNLDFEKAAEIRDKLRELKEIRIFV